MHYRGHEIEIVICGRFTVVAHFGWLDVYHDGVLQQWSLGHDA
jgi:hypothetical protein